MGEPLLILVNNKVEKLCRSSRMIISSLVFAVLIGFFCQPLVAGGGETCATATVIPSIPYLDSGSTSLAIDDYNEVCPYPNAGGRDVVYQFTPSTNLAVDVTLCFGTTNFDTKFYIYQDSCNGPLIGCNDDACSAPLFPNAWVSSLSGVNLGAGINYYLVVDAYSGGDSGDYSISIDINSCPSPTNLATTNITQSSANSSWTSNGTGSNWILEYGISGFTPGSGTLVSTASPSYNYSSLSGSTSYDWYVQEICGMGDTSLWSGPSAFSTQCPAITSLPWTEGFENLSTLNCWTQEFVQGGNSWDFWTGSTGGSILAAANGNRNAVFTSTNPPAETTKLITPTLDLSSIANPHLTFWYAQEVWSGDQNTLAVYVRQAPTSPWVMIWADSSNVPSWKDTTISLPAPTTTYQIGFEATDNWGHGNVIDSVQITGSLLPPVADFSYSMSGLDVIFTDISAGGQAIAWNWDFGDGNIDTIQNPTHSYTTAGSYTVTMTIGNSAGFDFISKNIALVNVNDALSQSLRVYPNPTRETLIIEAENHMIHGYSILTLLGQEVLSSDKAFDSKAILDVSSLEPGSFLLRLEIADSPIIRKILIQR